jgi:ribose 5-phosphate isomerase RpiB
MIGNGRALARTTVGIAQERPYPLVECALRALSRDGIDFRVWQGAERDAVCRWSRAVAECVAQGECEAGAIFCQDPGLACCVANKLSGVRAASVATVSEAARATLSLGANLLLVEMPGRTFFEVRQILRILATTPQSCPDVVACTLRELDGHAHR